MTKDVTGLTLIFLIILSRKTLPSSNGLFISITLCIYLSNKLISILTPLGRGTLIINLKALSSKPKSISLLWTRISNLSKLALPSPQGVFLVVILSFLVGKGIGPLIMVLVFLAISIIKWIKTGFIKVSLKNL